MFNSALRCVFLKCDAKLAIIFVTANFLTNFFDVF
jgi:hypothetical protein